MSPEDLKFRSNPFRPLVAESRPLNEATSALMVREWSDDVVWESLLHPEHNTPSVLGFLPLDWRFSVLAYMVDMLDVAAIPALEGEHWEVPHQTLFAGEMVAGGKLYCAGCGSSKKISRLSRIMQCQRCRSDVFFFHAMQRPGEQWLHKTTKQ